MLQVMERERERRGKRKGKKTSGGKNLSASYEFVKQLSNRSPLTSSSSSTLPAPPMSVNPLVKKQMFHHRGTSTRGCLTRRMECLLLLLGRQQTAGWESGQEERQESQSECQLAGLRLQQRHLPTHTEEHTNTHTHTRIRARMHISMQVHAALYIQANMRTHSPCHAAHAQNPKDDYTRAYAQTHIRTHAQPESPGSASFHSAGL